MRSVIVTGASRGLGLAIAVELAAAGFRVVAVARHDTEARLAAAERARLAGTGAIEFRALDLLDLAAIPLFVRTLNAELGIPFGLVNNAGLGTSGVLGVTMDRDIERLIKLNTTSPIVLTKYVVRAMMRARTGRVVNVSSIIAGTGFSGLSVYGATKASLIGFTRSLAREVGQFDVTVNAIAPGFIDTDMTSEMPSEQRDTVVRRSALRRLAQPVDVARSVAFLLGEGGRNITGTVLTVDAGSTA